MIEVRVFLLKLVMFVAFSDGWPSFVDVAFHFHLPGKYWSWYYRRIPTKKIIEIKDKRVEREEYEVAYFLQKTIDYRNAQAKRRKNGSKASTHDNEVEGRDGASGRKTKSMGSRY